MANRLLLVRSAGTVATRRAAFACDEPLDAGGKRVARGLAAALRHAGTAYSGPELRSMQTAIAAGLKATPDPDLSDLGAGAWTGMDLDEIGEHDPAKLRAWLQDPDAAPPGGESRTELRARVARFLKRANDERGGVVAITHASVVRTAVLLALDAPPQAFWRVDVAPGSVTELRRRDTGWLVARTNWTPP